MNKERISGENPEQIVELTEEEYGVRYIAKLYLDKYDIPCPNYSLITSPNHLQGLDKGSSRYAVTTGGDYHRYESLVQEALELSKNPLTKEEQEDSKMTIGLRSVRFIRQKAEAIGFFNFI